MTKPDGQLSKAQRKALAALSLDWRSPTELGIPARTLYALVTWRKAEMNSVGKFRLLSLPESGILPIQRG